MEDRAVLPPPPLSRFCCHHLHCNVQGGYSREPHLQAPHCRLPRSAGRQAEVAAAAGALARPCSLAPRLLGCRCWESAPAVQWSLPSDVCLITASFSAATPPCLPALQVHESAIMPAYRGPPLRRFLAACDACTESGHVKEHFAAHASQCLHCAINCKVGCSVVAATCHCLPACCWLPGQRPSSCFLPPLPAITAAQHCCPRCNLQDCNTKHFQHGSLRLAGEPWRCLLPCHLASDAAARVGWVSLINVL